MKKKFYAFTISALFMFASCQKGYDANNEDVAYGTKTIEYSIIADAPGYSASATKADLGAVARVYWDSNDKIKVYEVKDGNLNELQQNTLSVVEGSLPEDKSKATFSGTISALQEGSTLFFVYADEVDNIKLENNQLSYSLDGQEITGSRVPFVAYATAEYSSTQTTIKSTEFKLASSYVNVHLKDSQLANKNITGILISNTSNKVVLSADGVVTPQETTKESLYIKYNSTIDCGTTGYAMIAFAVPASAKEDVRQVTFRADGYTYFTNFSPIKLNAAKFYSTALTTFTKDLALPGVFTVANSKKVKFSPGNLQAEIDASGNPEEWKFAEHQYDYIGADVANTSIGSDAGTVDLFGWSTDAKDNNWGIHTKNEHTDDYTTGDFQDWGSNTYLKAVLGDGWYTLSQDDWQYLITNGKCKLGITVCDNAYCVVIAPDDKAITDIQDSYDETSWAKAEAEGFVCLPAAGYRDGSSVDEVGSLGFYWSSTPYEANDAYYLYFIRRKVYVVDDYRYYGHSVRLVRKVSE